MLARLPDPADPAMGAVPVPSGWTAFPGRHTLPSTLPLAVDTVSEALEPLPAEAGFLRLSLSAAHVPWPARPREVSELIFTSRFRRPSPLRCPAPAVSGIAGTMLLRPRARDRHLDPTRHCRWVSTSRGVILPDFEVRATPAPLSQLAARTQRAVQPVAIHEVQARKRTTPPSSVTFELGRAVRAAAAGLVVVAALWFGSSLVGRASGGRPLLSAETQPPAAAGPSGPFAWIRDVVASRATVELGESFSAGMDVWAAPVAPPKTWIYSTPAHNRRSRVALYRPSLTMADYRLEFLAQIDRKSSGWVVRARNPQNFYAIDLRVGESGLRPIISMVRYPVVEGKEGRRVEVPVPVRMENNTPYRVSMEVRGNRFAAAVEGQEVDSWTEDGLSSGGVGFFNDAGGRARVYWVRVTNHDDVLGRICGRIAATFSSGDGATAQISIYRPGYGPALGGTRFFYVAAHAASKSGNEGSNAYGFPGSRNGRG